MPNPANLYWIRNDLRLSDNPALTAAVASGMPVYPVFIWSPDEAGAWLQGGASRAWLGQSLASLEVAYAEKGSRLLVATGDAEEVLVGLCRELGVTTVYASHQYTPAGERQARYVREGLSHVGADLLLYPGNFLHAPADVETQTGGPYQVFTPYYKRCLKEPAPAAPLPVPTTILVPETWPELDDVASLALDPDHPWGQKILSHWVVGEGGAQAALASFLKSDAGHYDEGRDLPADDSTSTLSPYLHFGELSPRQVWHAVQGRASGDTTKAASYEGFLRQLYWREFAHHLLHHFPHTPNEPLKEMFTRFPWVEDRDALKRWQRGQTGYPLVDAGMRQLWETGWMHNRVRMVAASFLVKDLRIDWREGAAWFWDTLVDADLANNTLGWQWVAGCGADAAPYFRVFNPISQGQKFDPHGEYVLRWVPELADVPSKYIYCPWEMPSSALAACGVQLGEDYPHPMVDHGEARKAALAAYDELKSLAG